MSGLGDDRVVLELPGCLPAWLCAWLAVWRLAGLQRLELSGSRMFESSGGTIAAMAEVRRP